MISVTAFAESPTKPEGKNCGLSDPPDTAGEESAHGMELRIFPRRSDIRLEYTGCQVLWLQIGSQSSKAVVTEVVKGVPVRWWMPKPPGNAELTACNYKDGKGTVGNSDTCPSELNKDSLIHSLPPGCNKKLAAAFASKMPSSLEAKDCAYD